MREIEFIAWEKNLKEIIPVYNINFEEKIINTDSAWRSFGEIKLLQYTGLKDKNGKKIYEDNIIKNDRGTILRVQFVDGAFYAEGTDALSKKYVFSNLSDFSSWSEVIGNIYENPESLK